MNVVCIPTGPFDVNTYVVYDDGPAAFVVDPACCEYCNDQSAVVNFLKKNKLTCCAIILTHGHFDHVAGISYLKNVYSFAPVLINKNDSAYIGKDSSIKQNELLEPMVFTHFLPYVSGLCEPDAYLVDDLSLFECVQPFYERTGALANGLPSSTSDSSVTSYELKTLLSKWKVIETPGHSEGSVCIFSEDENLLFSGDTLFFKSTGRTDLPGGNEEELNRSITKLKFMMLDDTIVYPGHDSTGFLFFEGIV